MELSFFLVLLTGAVYLSFYAGIFLLKPALSFLFSKAVKNYGYFYKGIKAAFCISLVLFCFFYIPSADKIWINIKNLFSGINNGSFPVVDSIKELARSFRFFYPAGIAAGLALFFMIAADRHSLSFWHRFMIRFSHKQLITLVIFWTAFWIFEVLGDFIAGGIFTSFFIETLGLNICLYFSVFYIIYGFLIINYLMKRRGIPYSVNSIIIYGAIIISGDFLLYILILLLGVGITDTWMDYTKKKFKFNTVN